MVVVRVGGRERGGADSTELEEEEEEVEWGVFKQRLDTHTLRYANRYPVSLSCPLKEKPNTAVCGAPIYLFFFLLPHHF